MGAFAECVHGEEMLTVITQGRNDNYMGNFTGRLARTINKHASNIEILGIENEVEILCTDWGSESALYNALKLTDEAKDLVRYILVPPEIAKEYDKDAGFSVVHSVNTAARRASGDILLISDSDVYIPLDTMARLMHLVRHYPQKAFYWASKYHIPQTIANTSIAEEEMDEYISAHWREFMHEGINVRDFKGYGVALLVDKQTWFDVQGLDERLIYWGINDTDITHRLRLYGYNLFDLERMGMSFFHLEHYANQRKQMHEQVADRKYNLDWTTPETPVAINNSDWGLANRELEVINGWGM